MAKPFDATTKDLLEADPAARMAYPGLHPRGAVEVIDSDLSTVTAEADKVFRVVGPDSYLVHVEVQSSSDPTLPRRLFRSNAPLDYRHALRAWSVAVLLRPQAEAATLTGNLQLRRPDGQPIHDFRYGVVRAWRQPTEAILQGPLNLRPMALLADAPPELAKTIVERIGAYVVRIPKIRFSVRVMLLAIALSAVFARFVVAPIWEYYQLPADTRRVLGKLGLRMTLPAIGPAPPNLMVLLKQIRATSVLGPKDIGIPIYLDPVGLQEAGTTETAVIPAIGQRMRIQEHLDRTLPPLGLDYFVKDGMLTITSARIVRAKLQDPAETARRP